jgi:dimethylhistidine N-methyltransferase
MTFTIIMNERFAQDIKDGLQKTNKSIPSTYFYNERGTWLYHQIMQLPEYYLSHCETAILEQKKEAMLSHFSSGNKAFNLIDLGAGDGSKTKILLEDFLKKEINFRYTPIDLSPSILSALSESLDAAFPSLDYTAMQKDYWLALEELQETSNKKVRKVALFLGANIGNLTDENVLLFLQKLKNTLNKGDLILIGFDLKKRPEIIYQAYLDTKGTTAAFNLNLLHRINQEFDANFKPNYFRFYPYYNPQTGEVMSHLVSQKQQTVQIKKLDLEIEFDQWEAIHTEVAKKYTLNQINQLISTTGLQLKEHFLDDKSYFVNTLLEV